jgi:D-alanyl-D-alanine carboxypeptidase
MPRATSSACRSAVAGLAGLVCLVAPSAASAAPPAKLQRTLDRVVAAGAPGALVLVRDGDRTQRLTSGLGNLATRSPIRVSDRTRIGGITKTFTATVVLQLAGEGRLALEDTVERWLPGRISNGAAVTVRRLLDHTSGIFSYDKDPSVFAPYAEGDLTRVFDPVAGVALAAAHGPLFAPGSQLAYSNTNYVLLAMIVEAATGRSFASELRRRILAPLKLRHTSYPTSSRMRT